MDPKEQEQEDLRDGCRFPANISNELLQGIEPDTWQNVGPSIVHFSEVILQQTVNNGDNFKHLTGFLKELVDYLIKHVRAYELETFDTKNRVKSEMTVLDKSIENKLKQFQTKAEAEGVRMRETVDEKVGSMSAKIFEMDEKMQRVEDTSVVMERVNDTI